MTQDVRMEIRFKTEYGSGSFFARKKYIKVSLIGDLLRFLGQI